MMQIFEDAADREAVRRFRAGPDAGEEERLPSGLVDRLLAGDEPPRVRREQTGKRTGTVETLSKRAAVLRTTIDDLVAV